MAVLYFIEHEIQIDRLGLRDAGRRPGELEGLAHRRLLQQVSLAAGDAEDAIREERRDPDAGERHEEAPQQTTGKVDVLLDCRQFFPGENYESSFPDTPRVLFRLVSGTLTLVVNQVSSKFQLWSIRAHRL